MESNWTQPMIKAILLFLSAVCVHLSFSPPNPPAHKEELYRRKENADVDTVFEVFIRRIMLCHKVITYSAVAIELSATMVYYLHRNSSSIPYKQLAFAIPNGSALRDPALWATRCSPSVLLGTTLMISGSLLRLWCFHSLGRLFTFELSIQNKHKLITTGPYALVRHPAYLGGAATMIGTLIVFLFPKATWVNVFLLSSWPGMLFLVLWCSMTAATARGTSVRAAAEDRVLKETFGAEWEAYRERVPWMVLPWVY
ncbi:hypothetical protein NMY22_g15675 [Coprinellus aureogranulatus]|nr:hypothetical protein NMY22_g15675 [Coprinellus aureogranulatus]